MKNIYTILWIAWIFIVSVWAYFIHTNPSLHSVSSLFWDEETLLRYIPWELGQVLILQADENLKQVAQATNSFDAESFEKVFDTIEQVVVYQYIQDDNESVNLLFVQWDEAFDITTVEELGLIAQWDDFEVRELWNNIVLYSDKPWIDWYDSSTSRFSELDISKQFLDEFIKWEYNAWFFSTPEWVEQLWWYGQLVASNLESTYLLSSLNTTTPNGQLILQMKKNVIAPAQWDFSPMLQWYTNSSLFYLELQAIRDFLGIDESQINTFLPFVAWSAWIPLPSPNGITQLLSNNIGIIIGSSSSSPLGVQASLVIDWTQHYETLKTFYPFLEELIIQNLPLIASWTTLTTNETESSISSSLPAWELLLPILSLSTDADTTQLTLLWDMLPNNRTWRDDAVELQENTIALFWRDSSLLGEIVWWVIPEWVEAWTLQWSIIVDDSADRIVVQFLQETK